MFVLLICCDKGSKSSLLVAVEGWMKCDWPVACCAFLHCVFRNKRIFLGWSEAPVLLEMAYTISVLYTTLMDFSDAAILIHLGCYGWLHFCKLEIVLFPISTWIWMDITDGQTEILELQFSLKRTDIFVYPNFLGLHNAQLQTTSGREKLLVTLSSLHVFSEN